MSYGRSVPIAMEQELRHETSQTMSLTPELKVDRPHGFHLASKGAGVCGNVPYPYRLCEIHTLVHLLR